MINVGELVGSLSAAPLNDIAGRKGVFLVGSLFIVIGVALQLAASDSPLMIAGRVLLGLGVGNFSATSPLYMGVSKRAIHQGGKISTKVRTGNRARINALAPTHVLATNHLPLPNHRRRYQ